jgi:glycosyltransferase involved in cell wall biosynthesis
VLFVTHNVPRYEGDAAGSFVLRLAVALQQQGVRVHIVAPGAAGLSDTGQLEGVTIDRVRYASDARMTLAYTGTMAEAVAGSWSGRMALLQLLAATRRHVRRCLDDARRAGDPYDVVHVHWWFPSGLALLRMWRSGDPPRVLTMHGSDVRLAEKKPVVHPVLRAVLGETSVRTAVSSWLADMAHRLAPDAQVHVAPMPVDVRHFGATVTESTDIVRRGLLFVGRLNAQKGLADLLRAMASPLLKEQTLVVVGDGPERSMLEALAEDLGVAHRITWRGMLPQAALVALYRSARAVVMPSRGEGLGLVAVEAQLCATPVVAYADGGLVDVVRPNHGGTLVPCGDVQALAEAIARVTGSAETIAQLGALARTDMLQRFTPDAAATHYGVLYELAVRARPSAMAAP